MRRRLVPVWQVLHATYAQFDRDRIMEVAGGATFFILLALFPGFAAIVTLYGFLADRATIAHDIAMVSRFLPRGAVIVLNQELHRLIAQKIPRLGLTFAVSTLIALWGASGGVKALVHGLNVAYEAKERRGFIRLSLTALLLAGISITFFVLAMLLAGLLPQMLRFLPYHSHLRAALPVLSWPIACVFGLLLLTILYNYGPCRPRHDHWVTWGAVMASGFWLLGTYLFKWYVQHFGNFDRVYGSLGAIMGFLTWIWLSLVIILFGAELNRELERRKQRISNDRPQAAMNSSPSKTVY
jgi:membrane protein